MSKDWRKNNPTNNDDPPRKKRKYNKGNSKRVNRRLRSITDPKDLELIEDEDFEDLI